MIGANTVLNERYRLVSVLATGGMGVIWRGWDKRSQNVVAVKVLKSELVGQETFLARLRAEAQNAARLRHPNLAAVFDWGETQGQGWIVMELVEGRPFSDFLTGGKTLAWEDLAPILSQISAGLQACHEAHVIHRDVKPSNILVSDKGVAKLTDFGISLSPRAENLTAAGMVMGTAQYLPPEQAMGETASALGDIYALGIIAYEALAGKRPFTGATQVEIATAHVKEPVPPLPDTVAAPVADLIYRMLEKDPRLRPQSAGILVEEIRKLWNGQVPLAFTPRMAFARSVPVLSTQEIPSLSKDLLNHEPSHRAESGSQSSSRLKSQAGVSHGDVSLSVSAQRGLRVETGVAGFNSWDTEKKPADPNNTGLPAAVPVSASVVASRYHEDKLSASHQQRHREDITNHRKIIAAIIITALVLIALIIGLLTSNTNSAAFANLDTQNATVVASPSTIYLQVDAITQEEHLDGAE